MREQAEVRGREVIGDKKKRMVKGMVMGTVEIVVVVMMVTMKDRDGGFLTL